MANREMLTVLNSASQRHVINYTHLHEISGEKKFQENISTHQRCERDQRGGKVW